MLRVFVLLVIVLFAVGCAPKNASQFRKDLAAQQRTDAVKGSALGAVIGGCGWGGDWGVASDPWRRRDGRGHWGGLGRSQRRSPWGTQCRVCRASRTHAPAITGRNKTAGIGTGETETRQWNEKNEQQEGSVCSI